MRLERALGADSVWDLDYSGCEANHRRAWKWGVEDADPDTWVVILEDDIVLATGFSRQLGQILEAAPAPIVSLYLGRGRPPHWQTSIARAVTSLPDPHTCWLVGTDLLSAQGYAMRVSTMRSLSRSRHRSKLPVDEHISGWAKRNGHAVAYTWPSIVDHREDLRPLITERADGQPRFERRVAWNFGSRPRWNNRTHPLLSPEQNGVTVVKERP